MSTKIIQGENKLIEFQYEFEYYTSNVNVYYDEVEVNGIDRFEIEEVEILFVKDDNGDPVEITEEIEEIINERLKEMM